MKKQRKEVIEHKPEEKPTIHSQFWAGFAIIVLISVIAILSQVEKNPSLTGAVAVQNIAFVKQGSSMSLEVKNVPGLQDATLHFAADVKGGQINFKSDDSIPFEGKSIVKFTGSGNDALKISSIDLTIKLKESQVKAAGLKPEQVTIYFNGKELSTTKVDLASAESKTITDRESYLYYQATSTELGNFVVGLATPPSQTSAVPETPAPLPESTPEETTPTEQPQEQEIAQPTPPPLVGQAAAEPSPEPNSGFFQRIGQFFQRLFS